MPCQNCGHAVEMDHDKTDSTTELGETFQEVYNCPACGATGRINGTVGEPAHTWNRSGMVFNA